MNSDLSALKFPATMPDLVQRSKYIVRCGISFKVTGAGACAQIVTRRAMGGTWRGSGALACRFFRRWDDVSMAARSNGLVTALASAVRLYPRLSAGLAFELGVVVGAFVRSARSRGLAGASARLIEAVPVMAKSQPRRRKTARKPVARKRKPAKRARAAASSA
jgi:hypothetical protein